MAEVVAGALLSALFQTLFEKLASRDLRSFFRGLKVNEGLLRKLKIALLSANQVLDDAEVKQLTNPNVRKWLFDLKDTIYEAEDVLEEINYRALKYEQRGKPRSKPLSKRLQSCLNCFSTFDEAIERKIEEILDRLKFIVEQKDVLGLQQGVTSRLSQRLPASLANESHVYGRDDDKKKIMELLLSDTGSSSNKISVIPITGMGGVGKTTLAQLVYGDKRVQNQFHVRSWVIVSDESDVSKIAKKILEEITSKKCETEDLYQLQSKLEEELSGKRFLFVLDDVWNENYMQWDALLSSFQSGAHGSRIIVTTRSEIVANEMGNLPTYPLKTVSDDECWKLFADHAFKNASSETYPELQAIGRDIVKKCKGVPLAVKSLAGLLRSVLDPKEWKAILNSDIWELHLRGKLSNNILPSLWLSYHYLPSHLKRCFAYCSMFPKDYEMNELRKKEVILLWMAEGLLQCPGSEEQRIEEVGNEYFQDLISRSLFQPLGKVKSTILMHDLIHDLAMVVSGEFSIRLDDNDKVKLSSKTRHFSYSKLEDFENFDEGLSDAKSIRSCLRLSPSYYDRESPVRVPRLETLLRVGGCLRALGLSGCGLTVLPDSIGNLKHLRYLDLSCNFNLEEIPNTLCGLYYLQTLRLSWCTRLTQLPADMGNLVNLRHLYIEQVPLKKMPPNMCNLKDLQTLSKFVIGKNGGSSIEELGGLHFLSGALEISGFQNVDGVQNVRESYCCNYHVLPPLGQLPSLQELYIYRCHGVERIGAEFYSDGSFSNIKPFRSLKRLEFEHLSKWQEWSFPENREDGECFPSLEHLRIKDCPKLNVCLPDNFQHFPCLEELRIEDCEELQRFLGEGLHALTSLHLKRLPKLEDLGKGLQHLISLKELSIQDCENLQCLSENGLPTSLTSLRLERLPKLKDLGKGLQHLISLKELSIQDCGNLQCLSENGLPMSLTSLHLYKLSKIEDLGKGGVQHLISLEKLSIQNCENLQCLSENGLPTSLTSLHLYKLPKIEDLGKGGLQHLISLEELSIQNCETLQCLSENELPTSLTSLCLYELPKLEDLGKGGLQHLISLEELSIKNCENLLCLSENGLPTSLTSLYLEELPKLEDLGKGSLQHLISLKRLSIKKCENLQYFSENGLPTSLTSLYLEELPKLEDLGKGSLQHLISLKQLSIGKCENLQYLSETGLPTSLTSLYLEELPKLEDLGKGSLQHLISLEELSIRNCEKLNLRCLLEYGGLKNLIALKDLAIIDSEKLLGLLEEGLPPSLTSLWIDGFQNLRDLNRMGFQHLISLGRLTIWNCGNLQCLPEQGLSSSLSSLDIYECPLLNPRCQKGTGSDWHKISHIPSVMIDGISIA